MRPGREQDLTGRGERCDEADPEQLNAIAQNGGTDYDEYIPAADRDELTAALHELVDYTINLINCEFDINPVLNADWSEVRIDYSSVAFYLDGNAIPRDPGCAENAGWEWVIEEQRIIFCEEACEAIIEKGSSTVTAEFQCIPSIFSN